MNPDEIKAILNEALELTEVHVTGDGSHFQVIAVGDVFADQSRIKKQKMIYGPLSEKIADGSLHALSIKALTDAEWARDKKLLMPEGI